MNDQSLLNLEQTRRLLERQMAEGLQIGAQLFVSRGGRPLAELAVGDGQPGIPMTPDTVMLWLSSSKPVASVAVMQLVERGLLRLDDPVSQHIPEFGTFGKESITIRHLLTHTCGFRWVDVGWPENGWDQIIARICAAPLERNWKPGEKAGYHPYTSWYILGELVRRIDGRSFAQYVRDEVFLPLGMCDSWIGMPAEQIAEYGWRLGRMQNTERPEKSPHPWSTDAGIAHTVPGGNGHGPMRELARLYEMLLGGGQRNGVRLLSTESVNLLTSRQRVGMFDETFKQTIDWGLGFLLDSKQYGVPTVAYGYGKYASDATFGHSGSQSSAAFADPKYDLVVTIVLNGTPGERRHQPRIRTLLETVYEEAGCTG